MGRSPTGIATVALPLLLAALALAPAAKAAPLPIAGGETGLLLNRGLVHALRREGVVVRPLAPAKLKGRRLGLPVTSGAVDPIAGGGRLAQSGGLRLASGRRAVALRGLRFDASAKSLRATVAGRRLRLARLAPSALKGEGFNARLKAKRLPLAGSAASALNRALGLRKVFRAGLSLGSASGLGEPSGLQIASGQIAIGGPETMFSKLESLEVQLGIWGATQRWIAPGEGYFLFAVQPTTLATDASAGIVEGSENDGVTMEIFAPPPREMLFRHPRIDLASRELSATLSPLSQEGPVTETIATLDYAAAKFQVRAKVGVVEVLGVRAVADQFVAEQLNQRFGTPGTFQAGETLARITMTLSYR